MIDPDRLDWDKMNGLLPAVIQDERSGRMLMLGYMNRAALARTLETGLVTFYSRSKQRLWTKGEESGHWLRLVDIHPDCDSDSLLVRTLPEGPTCHLGSESCFGQRSSAKGTFLFELETVLAERAQADPARSYTARLLESGVRRIAQKVGEEGVEVALAGLSDDRADLVGEAADLLYHLLLLLKVKGSGLDEVLDELRGRHEASSATVSS